MFDPHAVSLTQIEGSAYVRFSLLALSSIFFLVDPFAALPTFLAVTADQDPDKRFRTARKASLTAFVILTTFAIAGTYIFRLFGITLPAFEISGGIILLLIGLDVIGDCVTEINVTSPTGFQEITQQTGFDVAAMFIDALAAAIAAPRTR